MSPRIIFNISQNQMTRTLRGIISTIRVSIYALIDIVSRTIINALGGSDTISSFFASAILQEFCRSKQNDVSSWELDDSHSRIRDHLRPEGNPVEQYYSYVRTERQTPSFERVALPVYCLLESDGKDKSGLPQGLVLLGMNEGRLDFLHCNNDGAGRIFTYMVLRTTRSSTTRCSVSSAHGEKLLLSLHIGPGDSLKINERKQHFQVVTFRMAIEYDLTILRRGFEATGIRSQSHRGPRRSSSLMIPLDNLDEINQIDEMSTRTSSSSLAKTMTDQATYGCPSRDELSDHIDQPDHVSETTNESASESPLTELTLTPTACTTSSPRKQRSAQPSSHGFGQGRLEKRPEPKKLAISLPSPQNQQAKISHINEAGNIEEAVDSSKRQAIVSEPALNTRSKSSQSEEIMSTSTRSSIMRLNTQESLLFPMHRPKGKLYTSLSKTVVGRAENPKTCQDSVQKGQHEDLELTSVPCPTSGGTSSSLNKNSNTSRKNTKSDSKPKVQTKGRKKGKKKMQPIRNAKPDSPSSIVDSVANDKAQNGRQANTFAKALKHDIATNDPEIDSSPLPEMSDTLKDSIDARTLPKHTRRKALGASIPSKQDWATGLAVADSRSSVKPEASGEQFRTTSTKSFSDQPQSSGQRAAVKLIAVLEESGILSENLDGSREIEIVNGPRDRLNQREPYTQSQVLYEGDKQGTSRFQTAEKRQQGTTMNEPHFAASLGGTQDSSLYAGTEQGQPTRNPRKRASIFENKNGHEAKRTRKTSSLLTTSSVEPWSTASTFQYRHTSSRTQPRERGRTIRPFHEISGNAVSLGANTNMPAVSHPETSDDIPIGDGFEKGRLSSERPVQSSKQKTYDRAGICLEPGPKTMIDKNGSPWRSQGNGEQVISQREAPISTKTTGRVHKDTDFVSKAPHVVTSRVEKQFLFPSGEGLSAVPQAISNESPDLEQEKRLDNGNLDQGAESQISSTNRWPLNRVGTDSKPALELTADAAHRQTLLEELHREIEKRLLSTDEVRQSRTFTYSFMPG
ncbi:hypothetical protein BJY01DRAFT_208014 [Aspergillus pseudoustus]|uniref:Telomere replication protein EST3 n=1 Tax=Aspergillus pseudoustus TaxID=1810923 RepID=A0ABR4KJQ5_9EURO